MFHTHVLVIGDVMLDRYLEGQVRRISPEAPVPVVEVVRDWYRPGGAGNVAASLAGLGCRVTLGGVLGADEEGSRLAEGLCEAGVSESVLVQRADIRTISKTRVVAGDNRQQVLRLDRDGDRTDLGRGASELANRIVPRIREHGVVVISDYDKGSITEELTCQVIRECRGQGIPCVIDPKKPSFGVYAGASILTPNLHEAARALGRSLTSDEAIATAAEELRRALQLDAMLITRGPEGMTLSMSEGVTHLPARTREVADVTGAGDTVVAVLAASLGAGQGYPEACAVANLAAGIAVGHHGCYVVGAEELEASRRGQSPKVRDWGSAQGWATAQRRAGRRVVFTNGCFDILHAGHLACLERARRLGDALVVGLNSDASVRLNKGSSRPIITEGHRAALLAGLACVDAVVLFDEMTPEALVRYLEPDILVKGGDYADRPIAGADFVRQRGGQVVTIPLMDGLSTTAILKMACADTSHG